MHLIGHLFVPRVHRATPENGGINDPRIPVPTLLDGDLIDLKARRATPGARGQGNQTAVESLRLAGPQVEMGLLQH